MCDVEGIVSPPLLDSVLVTRGAAASLDMEDTRSRDSVSDKGRCMSQKEQKNEMNKKGAGSDATNLQQVVRQPVLRYVVPCSIVVVGAQWPCWLGPCLALRLPIAGAFFPRVYHQFFDIPCWSVPKMMSSWSTYEDFRACDMPSGPLIVLSSGPSSKLFEVLAKVTRTDQPFIFAVDTPFHRSRIKDTRRAWYRLRIKASEVGLDNALVHHAKFGGATAASHQVLFRNVPKEAFFPAAGVPRVLKHLLGSAVRGNFIPIDSPADLQGGVPRAPIVVDSLLRQEGLLDVFHRDRLVACPSVFVKSRWVKRSLTASELLRAYDFPITLDARLMPHCEMGRLLPFQMEESISPLICVGVFRSLWGMVGGDRGVIPLDPESKSQDPLDLESKSQDPQRELTGLTDQSRSEFTVDPPLTCLSPSSQSDSPSSDDSVCSDEASVSSSRDRLDIVKEEHDLAKAVKSDDAEVPTHMWDSRVCRGAPTSKQEAKLAVMRDFFMCIYRRRLWRDCRKFLSDRYGKNWYAMRRKGHQNLKADLAAMQDILWRVSGNTWFEYPAGSRLLFFRFPAKYRMEARDGVPPYFTKEGPTSMRAQKPMSPEETAVLRDKILKVIKKRYIKVPEERLRSVISYFGVPKGVVDGIIQDWRIVYHAGANGLNDSVWAPSFWLPGVASLVRILDLTSVMEDRDIGEMFLNFPLHPSVRKFVGVDVGPLGFSKEECGARWLGWVVNLMGYRPSPHNSIKTNLVAEEIIRGDRHDDKNAFQWSQVVLNLPGSKDYNPGKAWISRLRKDGTLASDFVTFVDDQRLAAAGRDRMIEAGHTLSVREAYLGIQDALRKLRAAGGTCYPGAWAGAVVFVDKELGIVVLTSQEKWNRLKLICKKWLQRLESGDVDLNHTELRSDKGFMVHVTQAYPGMKPYLKGFHLSMETWRGGRDIDGWKLPPGAQISQDDLESVEEDWVEILLDGDQQEEPVIVPTAPESGTTRAVPRFAADLRALLELSDSDKPTPRVVRGKVVLTAYYGFGDASSGGFGASIERGAGIHGRFGLWGRDAEDKSSNYRELRNLVETVEEEAELGHLKNCELWLFTDNSTSESCFVKGSSSSPLLHELIVRLRKVEIEAGFTLHFVHVAGTRMIAQGTDGLSRGMLLEGVLTGKPMLSYIDLAKSAIDRFPPLLEFVRSWTQMPKLEPLTPEEWFVEAHGIVGGFRDDHGIWIPKHARNGRLYLWAPPPVIAVVCLEECLKAVHKRRDAFHVFVIPRLGTPAWTRLFHKLCDFVLCLPVGSPHWSLDMHEPLWIGISLPFISQQPWSLRGTPLLVELARDLRQVLSSGEADGGDILQQLLRIPRRVAGLSKHMARGVLRMPRQGQVPNGSSAGRGRQPVVQTRKT